MRYPWRIVVGVVAVGMILRGPIVAIAPVAGQMRSDLGLTAAQQGLFTTIPVLCFAAFAPAGMYVISRIGANATVVATIIGTGLGILIRSAGGLPAALIGTFLLGIAIGIGNVVIPVVIRREVAPRYAIGATGSFTAGLNIGTTITSFATAPLAVALGWRGALAMWVGLAVLAIVAWLVALPALRAGAEARAAAPPPERQAPRASVGWLVALLAAGFIGQGFAFYGIAAWFPTILHDDAGYDVVAAGAAAAVFQVLGIAGALIIPPAERRLGLTRTGIAVATAWLIFIFGTMFAPSLWLIWTIIGGIAQAGGLTVVFSLVVRLGHDDVHASRVSTIVQGVGYAGSAAAPSLIGLLHDVTGAWTLPLSVIAAGIVLFAVLSATVAHRVAQRT